MNNNLDFRSRRYICEYIQRYDWIFLHEKCTFNQKRNVKEINDDYIKVALI